eukprot:1149919-Pelagomonas_calceolata.AAC.1
MCEQQFSSESGTKKATDLNSFGINCNIKVASQRNLEKRRKGSHRCQRVNLPMRTALLKRKGCLCPNQSIWGTGAMHQT